MWAYALALVASWSYQGLHGLAKREEPDEITTAGVPGEEVGVAVVRPYGGPLAPVEVRVAWKAWRGHEGARDTAGTRSATSGAGAPVILIHGAPGGKENWDRLAPLLVAPLLAAGAEAAGKPAFRDVYAIDLPGFGASTLRVPDHSVRAGAEVLRAWMDAMAIERAHVVGWSNGGGVALHLAHAHPQRMASMTLLGSIGEQRFEGSGSHALEHGRYALGMLALGPALDLLPHFGTLGTRDERTGWLRSFSESDQRPFESMMREIGAAGEPATLIMHGRSDFLVPVRTAISAHARIEGSRLVLMDASHFIPFMQEDRAARVLTPFFAALDGGNGGASAAAKPDIGASTDDVPWLRAGTVTDVDAPPTRSPVQRAVEPLREVVRGQSAWTLVCVIAACAFVAPALAAACATMLVLGSDMDYLVAVLGVFAGLCVRDVVAAVWARRVHPGDVASRTPTVFEERIRLVPGSAADWSRRLARAPFAEAWTACLVRDVRESSAAAAARARGTPRQILAFILGRALGHSLVAMVSVMGALVVGVIAMVGLQAPAMEALARLGLDVALLWLPMLVLLLACARCFPLALSRRGRTRIFVRVRRCLHHEFWPSFVLYVPFWPMYAYFMIKYRGVLVWTCCNPGIGAGGGILGECKTESFEGFGAPDLARTDASGVRFDPDAVGVWPFARIPAGPSPSARAEMARDFLARKDALGGFPVVLKPDSGLRGLGVKLARTPEQLARYFADVQAPVLMQRFHPGPLECSALWIRHVPPRETGPVGYVYSITAKDFQVLEGDGARTLERLIDADRRARLQRDTFRERHADRLSWIPARGERVALNVAGNHCQGTIFRDGEHLRSAALERAIDRFCASYRDDAIDLVRLDIRYRSAEDLREGRGLAIVDVNGTMGESVNMYDPDRLYPWALRVMTGHWKQMFAIGAWRRAQGVTPLTIAGLIRLRGFYDEHRGSRVSD